MTTVLQRAQHYRAANNELFNALSHLVGGALGLVGLGVLLALALRPPKPLLVVAFGVYGLTLLGLYSLSTLYHFFCHFKKERLMAIFQRLDHGAIYVFIAGSYTPICLCAVGGAWGWGLLGAAWGLAVGGVLMKIFQRDPNHPLSFVLYLVMGWMAMVAMGPLKAGLSPLGLKLLLAGGLSYTLGAVVYATKRPRLFPGKFASHELWHLFVLGGSALHFGLMVTLA